MIKIQKTYHNEIGGFGPAPLKIIKQSNAKLTKSENVIGYVNIDNKDVVIKLNNVVTKKDLEELVKRLSSI